MTGSGEKLSMLVFSHLFFSFLDNAAQMITSNRTDFSLSGTHNINSGCLSTIIYFFAGSFDERPANA